MKIELPLRLILPTLGIRSWSKGIDLAAFSAVFVETQAEESLGLLRD